MKSGRRKFGKVLILGVIFTMLAFLSVSCTSASINSIQLTTNSSDDLYPSWSPDGTRIIFSSNRSGNYDIWVMDSDGSNQQRLNINDTWYDQISPTWSPDDSKIVFFSFGPEGYYKIYSYDIVSATVTDITPVDQEINPSGVVRRVSWGPTNRIAYDRWPVGIQTIDSTGGVYQRITNIFKVEGVPLEADWSSNATKIVSSSFFSHYFGDVEQDNNLAYVMNIPNTTEMTVLEKKGWICWW